ncbi:hypothetical protein PSTT_04444 [Puccinia striiformis]|uniref:Protein CPL1-like domain-containing protein n=1 Tax=Puccinia striiformis TaxID=27350 RepID=A0A2S4VSB9_9BASI|nr:hypothetical protein PSTT_04444 [Puccinia striiformis]
MTSCPIPEIVHHTRFHQSRTSHKKKSAWECVDLEQELTACGKCDNDCMRLPNVENVGCESGKCKIFTCKPGHSVSDEMDQSLA